MHMAMSFAPPSAFSDRANLLNLTIHAIYQSALEDDPWRACLNLITEYFQVTSTTIVVRPSTATDLGYLVCVPSGGEAMELAYRAKWYRLDPFLELPPERVLCVSDIMHDDQWRNSEYYRDFLQHGMPTDGTRALGVNVTTAAGTVSRLRLFRLPHMPSFTPEDKQQLALLVPHIKQALTLSAHLHRHASEREIYKEGLDRLNIGVIILDEAGRMLRANPVAGRILGRGDGIKLSDRLLEGCSAAATRELRLLMASVQADASKVAAMSLDRPAGGRKLVALVRAIPIAEECERRAQPAMAVFLRDPDAATGPAQEIARQLFDLTPSEANLALELVNGLSLEEAAVKLGVTRHTVRAHLRAIFVKTDVTRQSELVRVFLNGVLGLANLHA